MRTLLTALALCSAAPLASAAEIIRLTAENYEQVAPVGKEVDAIIGDYVLRNDKLVVVIGDTLEGRRANMRSKGIGGAIVDFTTRDNGSDQITAIYPLPGIWFNKARVETASGPKVTLIVEADATPANPAASVRYTLADGQDSLQVETTVKNTGAMPLTIEPQDDIAAIKTFVHGEDPAANAGWVVDEWWGQAYGFVAEGEGAKMKFTKGGSGYRAQYTTEKTGRVKVAPGESHRFARRLFAAPDTLVLRGNIYESLGARLTPVKLTVKDRDGFVADASVVLKQGKVDYGSGRTNASGALAFDIPAGSYDAEIVAIGRPPVKLTLDTSKPVTQTIEMEPAGYVLARITDEAGQPIPCKVQFIGAGGSKDPFFFPETGAGAVGNLVYSHHGRFKQALEPGTYDVVISYGTEYDIVEKQIQVQRGKETNLNAKLKRSVDSRGWISGEFHSHASPSGDNVSSQLGRVLNLLCEHIEYAPCTEHQRIDSYSPHLKMLGVEHLMATATGMELTSQLPFNHQNAFPLVMKPHTQDNGAPLADPNNMIQIERLAGWDDNAEKLVQQNHPNIMQIVFGKDADGKVADGLTANPTLKYMDVIEIHPPAAIFEKAGGENGVSTGSNRMVSWLQMINRGYFVPGVVNTDAHYNIHGSGYYRNYIRSTTDNPAEINTLDVVRECEKGHIVMSTAPFMEVTLSGGGNAAIPGDTVRGSADLALHVKVQCANWYDINRVQVFINGRPEPSLNFTRASHGQMFGSGVVKFEQKIPLKLERDAHVIVVAIGEGMNLGKVYATGGGAKQPPIAVSNPIFVDVDGGGFKPNGDDLGAKLPQ